MNIQKRLYTCACSPQVSPTVPTTGYPPITTFAIFERIYAQVCARVFMRLYVHARIYSPKNFSMYTYVHMCGILTGSALILQSVHMRRSCHYFTPIVTGSAALKRIRAPGIDRGSSIIDVYRTSAAELAVRRAGYR